MLILLDNTIYDYGWKLSSDISMFYDYMYFDTNKIWKYIQIWVAFRKAKKYPVLKKLFNALTKSLIQTYTVTNLREGFYVG